VLYVDGKLLGAVRRLAICQNVFGDDKDFMLFHCNDDWEVLGVSARPTVEENLDNAERWYEGISPKWVYTGITEETAAEYLRKEGADSSCSFCGKIWCQVDIIFGSTEADTPDDSRICSSCIEEFHESILKWKQEHGGS
jgi:hypothetical protein